MNKKNEKRLAALIEDVAILARARINQLPAGEDRDIAWACISSAIVGAAMHDGDPVKVMEILQSTVVGMTMSKVLEPSPSEIRINQGATVKFFSELSDEEFSGIVDRDYLTEEQSARLWKLAGRKGPAPKHLRPMLRRVDVDRWLASKRLAAPAKPHQR